LTSIPNLNNVNPFNARGVAKRFVIDFQVRG
jgi:hypothetical protein